MITKHCFWHSMIPYKYDYNIVLLQPEVVLIFSLSVRKYRKSYCTTPGVSIGGSSINKNVKSFTSKFLRPYIF